MYCIGLQKARVVYLCIYKMLKKLSRELFVLFSNITMLVASSTHERELPLGIFCFNLRTTEYYLRWRMEIKGKLQRDFDM
jgi:hypothetical protein